MNGYIGVGYTLKKKNPSDFLTGIDLKPTTHKTDTYTIGL